MSRIKNPNIEILTTAVEKLGELTNKMVFVGGCATGLLITDQAAPPIRVTVDVDAIVQVTSHADYYKLSDELRSQGFKEDTSDDAPICRWLSGKIILDVMPTDTRILGFGNKWYTPAIKHAELIQLPSRQEIHIVSAPYFLITKLEAYEGRGKGDYQMSHDMEDLIAVLDGRPGLLNEISVSDPALIKELSNRFTLLLNDSHFIDAISGHMPTDDISQARVPTILHTIREIANSRTEFGNGKDRT